MTTKYIRAVALLTALLMASAPAFAQGIQQQRVRFKAGTSSSTLNDSLKGDQTIDYLLGARAGQTMKVSLKANNGACYFNVLLHKDQLRVLRFSGNNVTSANPKEKVKASKQGDNWSISINDFYFYIIPEAVIDGG